MSLIKDAREAAMAGVRTDGSPVRRPLSPHLQVYDMLQMTSALSILNRATGIAWAVGLGFLVWWLVALAAGPAAFSGVQWFLGSVVGWVVLAGLVVVAWFHTLAGIRHMLWDVGSGFALPAMYRSGRLVVIGTAGLSLVTLVVLATAWVRA